MQASNHSRRRLIAGAAALPALAAALSSRSWAADARTVTIAYPVDILAWDALQVNPTQSGIIKCVYDQPIEIGRDLKYRDSVVSKYQWLDKSCTSLELTLRDDVKFHNGDRFTSADVRYSFFERPQAEKISLLAGVWNTVSGIETPTATRAIMKFSKPMATAPIMLGDIPAYLLPKAYSERVGKAGFELAPVGSGPFKVVEYQRDVRIVLEANENYWRGAPRIKRLVFQITKDPTARAAAMQSGQADVTMNLPVRDAERLGALPGLEPHIDPTTGIVLLMIPNTGAMQDRNLRLALHHAIDKPTLSKALFGGHATPIWMPAGPGMPSYVPDFKIAFDPSIAKALLAKAGYGPDKPAAIKFYTTKGVFPSDYETARAIQQMWKRVGIEADLQVLDSPTLYSYQNNGKFEGPVLKPFNPAGGDPGTYSGFMLDPAVSFAVWKSQDIPSKLYPLMAEADYDKRIAGFKAFDQWQVEQGYSIPLFLGLTTIVARKTLALKPHRSGVIQPYDWT